MDEEKKAVATAEEGSQDLKRGIAEWQVAFIGLGGVIGSCYFLGVGWTIEVMGPAVFWAFLLVGVIVFGLMISYAELLVNLPRSGSFIAYTNEFLGPTVSTGFGWAFWFNWVCYVPSEAIAVSAALQAITGITSTVAYLAFAIGTMIALTVINCFAVDLFAKIESGLAITKVIIIILFILMGLGIWVGFWGSPQGELAAYNITEGFKGTGINFPEEMSVFQNWFPHGILIITVMMVVVLVTMQGTEIVGLAAAESKNPDVAVPKACRSVTYRIVALYLAPILLVLLIYPTALADDSTPVFAEVARDYGLTPFFYIFAAVVMVAAFSCGNTGFYGTVRAMYGLSTEGLAPKFLSHLSKNQAPRNAVIFTMAFMWIVLLMGLISEVTGFLSDLYGSLLCMSGFTGTLAWVGIIASQKRFRVRLKKNGYEPDKILKARVKPAMSWIPWFALIAQIACLIMLAFATPVEKAYVAKMEALYGESDLAVGDTGGGIVIFCIATAAIVIPMIVYQIQNKRGKVSHISTLHGDEKTFEEAFPPINK
jgi:AAT family amino acid transporter